MLVVDVAGMFQGNIFRTYPLSPPFQSKLPSVTHLYCHLFMYTVYCL